MVETGKKAFNLQVRIYYEDTDAGGVVYHSCYLNFMERARTEWLRNLGFEQGKAIKQKGILFAVKKINIDYHRPAFFDQLLDIKTYMTVLRRVSLIFEQIIFNSSKEVVCRAEVKIVCISSQTMKPTSIPEKIASELN